MRLHCTINNKPDKASATEASATEASANEASANEKKSSPPALASAQPSALRSRPPPLPWPAWVASPHHHAPSGREVDGALSRPSPKRNGAPNTVPDYRAPCTPGTAFRFVKGRCESCYQSSALVSSHIRAPRHLHRLVCECLSATKGERGRGRIDSDRKIPERHLRLWTGWPAT